MPGVWRRRKHTHTQEAHLMMKAPMSSRSCRFFLKSAISSTMKWVKYWFSPCRVSTMRWTELGSDSCMRPSSPTSSSTAPSPAGFDEISDRISRSRSTTFKDRKQQHWSLENIFYTQQMIWIWFTGPSPAGFDEISDRTSRSRSTTFKDRKQQHWSLENIFYTQQMIWIWLTGPSPAGFDEISDRTSRSRSTTFKDGKQQHWSLENMWRLCFTHKWFKWFTGPSPVGFTRSLTGLQGLGAQLSKIESSSIGCTTRCEDCVLHANDSNKRLC